MKALSTFDYDGGAITFRDDGWFNATQAAARFARRPVDWIKLDSTKSYIAALSRHNPEVRKFHFAQKGGSDGGSTWMHPKLAIPFARWLNEDFAIWCDAQIDGLIRGKDDWRKLRHQAASSFKVMTDLLRLVRAEQGKDTASRHYSNEARLVNFVLCNEFKGLDRDALSAVDLALLGYLEERNAVLIGRGIDYAQRKTMLRQYGMDWRMNQPQTLASQALAAIKTAVAESVHG